jgi:putative transcriptional regulator
MEQRRKKVMLVLLGKRVKRLREEKGFSQTELAHTIGKDQPSIQRIEAGNINPSYIYLQEVAEGLGISMDKIVDGL